MKNHTSNRGFIQFIILIIIVIAVLSYFGINIQNAFNSPTAQSNFGFVGNWVQYAWNNWLATPVTWVWDNVVVGILWNLILKQAVGFLQHAASTGSLNLTTPPTGVSAGGGLTGPSLPGLTQ
jgi:hypothetical protein